MRRPAALTPHQQAEVRERRDRGDTLVDIAKTYGVSHMTIARLCPAI
jgi:Helix-turn-helix domain of resolvase